MLRIGIGTDTHRLVAGRELVLGGVRIASDRGADGHSDADALTHAIADAILGALCEGDIGVHFPDTDPRYKNIDSTILLKETMKLIGKENYRLVNIDSTLCLQEPKIRPYVSQMVRMISDCTGSPEKDISIKATTTELLGFVGRKEGVVAYATVLLETI